LVTDNGSDGQSIGDMLKQQAIHISTATSAKQVLQLMRNNIPDLILMDMQIPELDGYETARAIRREKKYDQIPIIAITPQTTTGNREKYFQAGMNDYISKPIFPDRLITVLRSWLSMKKQPDPAPRQSAESDLHLMQLADALPGFDVTEALTRLEGNFQFFKELLKDLRKNLMDARSKMRSLIRDGALDEALIRLHGLKGVCANLEAIALRRIFQNLELALATSQQEQYEPLTTRMEQTIDQNLTNISTILEAETDTAADSPSTDTANRDLLVKTLEHLVWLLDQRRLDAVDSFEQLKGLLPLQRRHPEFIDLAGFIGRLDYANARKALIALAASMEIAL
jgi:two-component system, sensor histidine kinase and response regulator